MRIRPGSDVAGPPAASVGRQAAAVVAAAGVAGLGGLLLGEYAFDGLAVMGAGVVLGLFVSEAALAVISSNARPLLLGAACAVVTVLGLLLAAWTSTGHRLGTVGTKGDLAFVLGALAATIRMRPPRRGAGNLPGSAPEG